VARPRKFDHDEALKAAKALFWKKGYDATTTDDLRHAMGIGRQSLYGSFGGKRLLYLEVLRRYNTESIIAQITRLRAAASPLAGIRELLLAFASDPVEKRKLGCMGIAAICTFGSDDTDVSAISHSSDAVLKSTLEEVLANAKRLGETRPSLDVRATAHFIQATMIGIKVSARAGAHPKILRSIALTALEALVPP
jgi:TetR/AcrR family transcriptional regulator, transcriptional repressor for nem operon